jgi:hypothetical protein
MTKIFNPNTGELTDFKLPRATVPPGWVRLSTPVAIETAASLIEMRENIDRLQALVDSIILDFGSDE